MNAETLVRGYVDSALGPRFQPRRYIPDPHMPAAMVDSSLAPRNDWRPWKPVESTVTDEALNRLERTIGLRFPPSYRVFLKCRHFYEVEAVGLAFEPHVIGRWEDTLLDAYDAWMPDRIIDIGLIPFGREAFFDAGPVCFDTRGQADGAECPVVYWDHGWIGTDKEVRPMFSSSLRMFEAQRFVAENDMRFLFHEQEYPPEVVENAVRQIQRFLAIDPDGAGGAAREYWSYMAGGREI